MFKYILITLMCIGGYVTPVEGQSFLEEKTIPTPKSVQPQIVIPPKDIQPGRPYGQVFTMRKQLQCNDSEVIDNYLLNSLGQQPYTWGLNYNQMGIAHMLTIVYVNPQTRTFSIVEHNTLKLACIIGTGQSFDYLNFELMDPPGPAH